MNKTHMELHQGSLEKALSKLATYQPDEQVWENITGKLDDAPLHKALAELPEHEPDERLWKLIEVKTVSRRLSLKVRWYAAAAILFGLISIGLYVSSGKIKTEVSYSLEIIDQRLQADQEPVADDQYQKLKAVCEAETVVCSSTDFKRLKKEYEALNHASQQLKQAMGEFNTEPDLMRQFSTVEQEKAEVLNEMAKMI